MTTQNLGVKRNRWAEERVEYFDCCYDKICVDLWVSNPRAIAKNFPLYRSLKSNFADEECYIISTVSKI